MKSNPLTKPVSRNRSQLAKSAPKVTTRIRPNTAINYSGLTDTLQCSYSNEDVLHRITALCEATRPTPDGLMPDWSARARGLDLLLLYRVGSPLQRKEEIQKVAMTDSERASRFKTKPALRRAMMSYLQSLEDADSSNPLPGGTEEELSGEKSE